MAVLREHLHLNPEFGRSFFDMRTLLIILILSRITLPVKSVESEENIIDIYIEINPEPKYNQLIVDKIYGFNLTLLNKKYEFLENTKSNVPPKIDTRENFTIIITYEWWIKGTYSYGGASSGYSNKVDSIEEIHFIKALHINESNTLFFNKTFIRDTFNLGAKPYEKIEIKIKANVYHHILNPSDNETTTYINQLANQNKQFLLLDELKIKYVKGKYEDLKNELELLKKIPDERTSLVEENYIQFITDMNRSIGIDNYYDALDIYQDYERTRIDLLAELIYDLNSSFMELDKVKDLENRIQRLESDYGNLEKDYIKLQEEYYQKTIQLENQRQMTITVLAGISVSAFIFFLIGRNSYRLKLNL